MRTWRDSILLSCLYTGFPPSPKDLEKKKEKERGREGERRSTNQSIQEDDLTDQPKAGEYCISKGKSKIRTLDEMGRRFKKKKKGGEYPPNK